MTERRKRLDDKFRDFVKGKDKPGGPEEVVDPRAERQNSEALMTELMKPAKIKRVPVTLTMAEDLNNRLTNLAKETDRTRSELVEIALRRLFEQVDKS